MVLCNDLYKVILSSESVDEILKCDHSNESFWAVLSCGTVYYAVQGGSTFESVDEILKFDYSKESNLAALSAGTTFIAYNVVLTFASVSLSFESVDWPNPELRPCIQIKPVDENNDNFFSLTYKMTKNGAFPLLSWCCLFVFVFNFNVLFVFFIIAIGDPKPIIAWRKDGKVLGNSQKYSVRRNGALIITHAQYNDSGRYECVARTNWEQADGFTNLMVKGRREERKNERRRYYLTSVKSN